MKLQPEIEETHRTWHKFSNWMVKTFGKDLHGEWEFMQIAGKKLRHRSFDELELSRRLVGYKAMQKIERYAKRHCPEIRILNCDDSVYASSMIILVPHPRHGITMMFVPQCTTIQNQFFLYESHYKQLLKALKEMKSVYAKN